MENDRVVPDVAIQADEADLKKIKTIIDPLILTENQVQQVMKILLDEIYQALNKNPEVRKKSSLQCENTYVRDLLNGQEEGDFLALDLGGTNFRVLLCKMRKGNCESISRNYNVPTPKLYGPSVDVFDHLAESIFKFLKEENMLDRRLPLGFTFSFPMIQEGLKKGILVTWTKSFACTDGVGDDAGRLLEEAINRRGDVKVDVIAILNDATGTLMAGSYLDRQCEIGVIMGTGCNAAYLEKLDNVDKWTDDITDPKHVVIDIEWGAFGDNGSLDFTKTEFDTVIDLNSNHIGSFTDTEEDCTNTTNVLKELGLAAVASSVDIAIVRYLCGAMAIRATQFVSASIATLVNHIKKPEMTIAIDGSLYKYHPKLHDMMTNEINRLAPESKSKLILAEDGSGRGAAFVAAVASRLAGAITDL